ncbi:MAG: hypothetical protein OXB86_05955 [Bdellovibrionales bacterium]|nr:hypothetical protein [Bdellovibrionales bacterium]
MVDNLYSLVEVVLGSSLLLWGMALVIHVKSAQAVVDFIVNDETSFTLTYIMAAVFLSWGLAIIWIHNEWVFDFPVIVTLIGWLWTIKCFLWLVIPGPLRKGLKILYPILKNHWFLRGYGAFIAVLGALIIFSYVNGGSLL